MVFEQMAARGHERVLFVQDASCGLRGIIAIHNTRLGPALGGVRRWNYATEEAALEDVLRLSEAMTYKAAAAHLPMGGAKSVIMLEEAGARPSEEVARAMGRAVHTLRGDYIAAEDVGVDTQYIDWMAAETPYVMGGETISRGGDPSPYTARGVANGMRATLRHKGRSPEFSGLRVALQGLGHVGFNLASILRNEGATVIATDINPDRVSRAKDELGVTITTPQEILFAECDILCPCALGGVIREDNIGDLRCEMLVPAANNVLNRPFENARSLLERGIAYAPDFVVNAGGLIQLAGLWLNYSQTDLDRKIAQIEETTLTILSRAESAGSSYAAAFEYAQDVIGHGVSENADVNVKVKGTVHAG